MDTVCNNCNENHVNCKESHVNSCNNVRLRNKYVSLYNDSSASFSVSKPRNKISTSDKALCSTSNRFDIFNYIKVSDESSSNDLDDDILKTIVPSVSGGQNYDMSILTTREPSVSGGHFLEKYTFNNRTFCFRG